jgi:hypothetical protein
VVLYDFENQQVKDLVKAELEELYRNKRKQQAGGKEAAEEDLVLSPSVHDTTPTRTAHTRTHARAHTHTHTTHNKHNTHTHTHTHTIDVALCQGKISVSRAERDDNEETSTFVVATSRAMKITSGSEALYLLAKSDRISEDLNKILPYGEQHFDLNLILREWRDEVIERPQVFIFIFIFLFEFSY